MLKLRPKMMRYLRYVLFFSVTAVFGQVQKDIVHGNLIQFNDNGAWCWYQDERAVVDTAQGKLIVGSVASDNGAGGSSREGNVEAVVFDLQSRTSQRYVLRRGASGAFYADDHNTPAFFVRPDGNYVAMYTAHNAEKFSYWRIFDGKNWSAEQKFDWNTQPGGADFNTTYSNVYFMSSEGRLYNFSRGAKRSPNLMMSTDFGDTWTYGGRVTSSDVSVGYVDGYFRYCGNGIDRVDFICTEHHPRDYNTSIYHGYIKNGQSFQSNGTLMDSTIFDQSAPNPFEYTTVFAANTVAPPGRTNTRCWNIDVQRYDDGTIATLVSTRVNDDPDNPSNDPDHAFFYCRYNGSTWKYTYLGKAGKKLYSSEQDYTGLGALCPNDPNTIYISTPIDPRDSTINLGVHEIFKGVTSDSGATWEWTPITQNSVRDNLRPIIPAWDKKHTVLLWWRGTYYSAQNFDAAVVGIVEQQPDSTNLKHYVDATSLNTVMADGSPLIMTGPAAGQGPADNKWDERTGYGNGGSVLTSAEAGGEDAPLIKTRVVVPEGTYDFWVNFWGNPDEDWRIKAGLSLDHMQLFREMACRQVEAGEYQDSMDVAGSGNTFLYQAYLGRIRVSNGDTVNIFVDDSAVAAGSVNSLTGGAVRTWYDGISYAVVNGASVLAVNARTGNLPSLYSLSQNYPNPFNPTTTIRFAIPVSPRGQAEFVSLKVYDLLGREVATLVNEVKKAGSYTVTFDGSKLASGVYFYRMKAGSCTSTKKLLLMK